MKPLLPALGLLAALTLPNAMAGASGSLQLDHLYNSGVIELGNALPAGAVLTGASLSLVFDGWGSLSYPADPVVGDYRLLQRDYQSYTCPHENMMMCALTRSDYERDSVLQVRQDLEQASLRIGTVSAQADNGPLVLARRDDHGTRFERSEVKETETPFGSEFDADGKLIRVITTASKTVDNYAIHDWTELWTRPAPVRLTLELDGASLALLNSEHLINYELRTLKLWGFDATLNYDYVPGAVPEPGSAAMLLAGLAICATVRRRQRR